MRLKFNLIYQCLVHADDVSILGDNMQTIYTESVVAASKEVGVEIDVELTKYMLLSPHQNVRQNHDMKIAVRSVESVAKFKYFKTTVRYEFDS
jgi:hypothetical protein